MSSSPVHIKVRYIFVPLLELAVGFCVVYSALNWLLVARGNLVPLSDDVATYWLPLGLAWLLVIFKVQPGLRLLMRDKRQNLPILYHAAAVAMIAVPTILVQGCVRTATGDLTHVRSLADISSSTATKYYSADDLCIDRSREWLQPAVSTSGRFNDTLNFYVYVAFPLCQMDRVRSRDSVWVGYEFHKAVSNSLPTEEKDVLRQGPSWQLLLVQRCVLAGRSARASAVLQVTAGAEARQDAFEIQKLSITSRAVRLHPQQRGRRPAHERAALATIRHPVLPPSSFVTALTGTNVVNLVATTSGYAAASCVYAATCATTPTGIPRLSR